MLHHWTCLPALSVLQGKSIWKHILISIELPCKMISKTYLIEKEEVTSL